MARRSTRRVPPPAAGLMDALENTFRTDPDFGPVTAAYTTSTSLRAQGPVGAVAGRSLSGRRPPTPAASSPVPAPPAARIEECSSKFAPEAHTGDNRAPPSLGPRWTRRAPAGTPPHPASRSAREVPYQLPESWLPGCQATSTTQPRTSSPRDRPFPMKRCATTSSSPGARCP